MVHILSIGWSYSPAWRIVDRLHPLQTMRFSNLKVNPDELAAKFKRCRD